MSNISYIAKFSYCDDGICVTFPDVPGAITEADTKEEAIEMAKDALVCWFSDGTPLPPVRNIDELRGDASLCRLDEEGLERSMDFVEITAELEIDGDETDD
jgi:predicted RNase H-like HicB family nuclease